MTFDFSDIWGMFQESVGILLDASPKVFFLASYVS